MPIRKLTRSVSGEECGAENMVSGGIQQQSDGCGDAYMVSGGMADPLGKQGQGKGDPKEQQKQDENQEHKPQERQAKQQDSKRDQKQDKKQQDWLVPSRGRLERSASEVISALHQAKQELAKELEANLKQLRAVLTETQKIAKEMEAVLREAKNEPDPEELARGEAGRGQKQADAGKKEPADPWNPPDFRRIAQKGQDAAQKGQEAAQKEPEGERRGSPPPWEPPDALEQSQQQPH